MPKSRKPYVCGFCSIGGRHEYCPVVIDHADGHGGPVYCDCANQRPELHPRMWR